MVAPFLCAKYLLLAWMPLRPYRIPIATPRGSLLRLLTTELDVEEMDYRQLQKECKTRGLKAKGTTQELRIRLTGNEDLPAPAKTKVKKKKAPGVTSPVDTRAEWLRKISPVVDDIMTAKVKQEIFRASTIRNETELLNETAVAIEAVMGRLEIMVREVAREREERRRKTPDVEQPPFPDDVSQEMLDSIIAPLLPFLLMPSYAKAARDAMARIETQQQQAALFFLTQYMIGVFEETSDRWEDKVAEQTEKLRQLLEAALDGHESISSKALEMKDDLDSDFLNFLDYAIGQEESKLRAKGIPVMKTKERAFGKPLRIIIDDVNVTLRPTEDSEEAVFTPERPLKQPTGNQLEDTPGMQDNQLLLILRIIRHGVFSMKAKDYEEDIFKLRMLMELNTNGSRTEMTRRALNFMTKEEKESFINTVTRVYENMATRPDRDVDLLHKVTQVKQVCDAFEKGYAGVDDEY